MIRLRQTDRTNVRPRSDSTRVTSQRQERNLHLIHLRNRMIMTEKLPVEHLVSHISEFRVSRRLGESVLPARRPVVGPILKQRHRTARLAWARARYRWILHTWQHIHFNDESQFSLRFSDVCTAGVGNVLRTSVCTSPTVLEAEVLWSGWNLT